MPIDSGITGFAQQVRAVQRIWVDFKVAVPGQPGRVGLKSRRMLVREHIRKLVRAAVEPATVVVTNNAGVIVRKLKACPRKAKRKDRWHGYFFGFILRLAGFFLALGFRLVPVRPAGLRGAADAWLPWRLRVVRLVLAMGGSPFSELLV